MVLDRLACGLRCVVEAGIAPVNRHGAGWISKTSVIPGAMQRGAVHRRPGISLGDHDMQNPGDAGVLSG